MFGVRRLLGQKRQANSYTVKDELGLALDTVQAEDGRG